ncbi:DUF6263 family protein [Pedobacter sp. MW01-1-1]|uniref:DUF6263 family protein n=1 Tax=Pedobacter sp. MW01-1-1 TaxID=3383027 RepID=UPI003FEFA3AC
MSIKRTAILYIGLLSLVFSTSAQAQKAYVLKQSFPVGKKYDYNFTSSQIIKQKYGDKEVNITQTIGTDYTFEVQGLQQNDKNIKVYYNRLTMKSSTGGNSLTLDSEDKTMASNPFAGMKGASFNMLISSNGDVKAVTGLDKMIDDIVRKSTTDTAKQAQMRGVLGKQFSEKGMKESMQASLKIYPQHAVKVGDSWTIDSEIQLTMPIGMKTVYKLIGVKDEVATVLIRGTMVAKGNFDLMGSTLETDLSGTNDGDVQIDLKTGMLIRSSIRLELFGTLKAADQVINFDMEGMNTVTGKEIL